jgi:hypothetical protein
MGGKASASASWPGEERVIVVAGRDRWWLPLAGLVAAGVELQRRWVGWVGPVRFVTLVACGGRVW